MKALFAVLAIALFSSSSFAEDIALGNFKKALAIRVGDFSKSQEFKWNIGQYTAGICGSTGPSLIATLLVNKPKAVFSDDGKLTIIENFESIKKFGIDKADGVTGTPEYLAKIMMDEDTCLE